MRYDDDTTTTTASDTSSSSGGGATKRKKASGKKPATKAKAKAKAAKAKAAKAKAAKPAKAKKASGELRGDLEMVEGFPVRPNSFRAKAIKKLAANKKSQVKIGTLCTAVYGENNPKFYTALRGGVVGGLNGLIEANKLNYQIKTEGRGEDFSIGLYPQR